MKTRKRILAAVLTAIMMISLLPANTFATETVGNGEAESAVEAVSVSTEEQDVETTVEDVSEDLTEETSIESSETDEVEETADPAAEETIETVEETVEQAEEAEAAAEPEKSSPVTLEKEGSDYVVTVTYDASALLPEGTDIMVKEIKETAKKYDSYYDQALEAVQKENEEAEEISYIRLFDISLVDGAGSKVEPKSAVDVQIRLKDVETVEESTQIVHFAGEEEIPEVIEPTTVENDTVAFATEGFSIYAVVTTGEFARLTVNFNVSEGNTTTMYVKQKDITEGKLNQVLYDPGVPVQDGKKFLGWTKEQNWTSLSLEDLKADAMTIDDVRSDVTDILNAGITDGQPVNYYPIMVNIFELYYQDEEENTFKTESLLSATDSATTTVDLAYTLTGGSATQNFIGWKVKGTDAPVYPNGSSIEIESDTILVPAIGEGRWLWFDSNAGGAGVSEASYTAPQFVAAGKTPTQPADPTRPGYQFAGWFDAAEGGNEFDFSEQWWSKYTPGSDEYVWAYAHWTAEENATYKVVIWAQKVTDDKDAADDAKTYDYVETYTVSGAVVGTVLDEAELRNSSNNYFGKDNAYFGANDLKNGSKAFEYARIKVERGIGNDGNGVNPDGSTVVNVYYDRALMTIVCGEAAVVGRDGTSEPLPSQDYYEPTTDPSSGTIYGLVNGEYVPIERTLTGKKLVWIKYNDPSTVYNPQYIYYDQSAARSGSTSYRYSESEVQQANATIVNNANVGTAFGRINTSNKNLTTSTSSTYKSMYYGNGSSNPPHISGYVVGTYTYTVADSGQEYTGTVYHKITKPAGMTGLYGQNLSQYGYTWPRPSSGGTWNGIAFLDTFTGSFFGGNEFGKVPNVINLDKDSQSTNLTMIFYLQDKDNPDQYNEVDRADYALSDDLGGKVRITERILGGTSKDYSWSTSASVPTTWHTELDASGRTAYTRSDAGNDCRYIHIRYDRVANNIIFMQGSNELKTVGPVRYEESLEGYEGDAPDSSAVNVEDDEFFDGWYEDPEGFKRVKWNELTMPLGNKIIYAVVRHSEYHVYIDMDGGTLPSAQRNQFWENWGRTIDKTNFMNATKTDAQGNRYTLVGYYWDEALTKPWNFDIPLSEEYLWHKYDDSHGDDPYRTSEFFGERNYDSNYPQCVGIFRLWAKWRNESILNMGGLNIRYRDPGEDETDDLYVDPMHYADMSDVIAAQAPEETGWPSGMRFDGWQLGDKVYQPGDVFVADSDDAVIENDKYWITLTAVYVEKENRTPTHVTWYKNDGSGAYYHSDDNYSINEPIPVYGTVEGQAIPTREHYTFLGWAKDTERVNAQDAPNTSTTKTTADFLEYRNGKFYLPGTTTEITEVAADEVTPYQALYAIWEREKFYIYHSATEVTEEVDMPEKDGVDLTAKVTSGNLYGGYFTYTETGDHKGDFVDKGIGTGMEPTAGETYYLKEVSPDYLKPNVYLIYSTVHNNLIQDLYGFVNIDYQNDYEGCGLMIGGKKYPVTETLVTDFISVTRGGEVIDTLTAGSLFNGTPEAVFGYANLKEYVDFGVTVQITGYYVTKDKIRVTGYKDRMIKFDADDRTYDAPVFTGWNSGGNTKCGLKSVTPTLVPATDLTSAGMLAARRTLTLAAPADQIEYTITKVYDTGSEEQQIVQEGNHIGEITYTERNGYLFAGWYKDQAFTEPADFADVQSNMTVYARFVSSSDISMTVTRKSQKYGTITFNTVVKVNDKYGLGKVNVNLDGADAVLSVGSVKKSGSGKNVRYTTQYQGTVPVKGLSVVDSFKGTVSWTTPDGTVVTGRTWTCTYVLGLVTVR